MLLIGVSTSWRRECALCANRLVFTLWMPRYIFYRHLLENAGSLCRVYLHTRTIVIVIVFVALRNDLPNKPMNKKKMYDCISDKIKKHFYIKLWMIYFVAFLTQLWIQCKFVNQVTKYLQVMRRVNFWKLTVFTFLTLDL
jgi:hypothetical protein